VQRIANMACRFLLLQENSRNIYARSALSYTTRMSDSALIQDF